MNNKPKQIQKKYRDHHNHHIQFFFNFFIFLRQINSFKHFINTFILSNCRTQPYQNHQADILVEFLHYTVALLCVCINTRLGFCKISVKFMESKLAWTRCHILYENMTVEILVYSNICNLINILLKLRYETYGY